MFLLQTNHDISTITMQCNRQIILKRIIDNIVIFKFGTLNIYAKTLKIYLRLKRFMCTGK